MHQASLVLGKFVRREGELSEPSVWRSILYMRALQCWVISLWCIEDSEAEWEDHFRQQMLRRSGKELEEKPVHHRAWHFQIQERKRVAGGMEGLTTYPIFHYSSGPESLLAQRSKHKGQDFTLCSVWGCSKLGTQNRQYIQQVFSTYWNVNIERCLFVLPWDFPFSV